LIERTFVPEPSATEHPETGSSEKRLQLPGVPSADFIGTAGWNVPSQYAVDFRSAGTHLQRYATRLNAVEINSSFYRPHRRQTYERWARSVPEHFRFAVKVPKAITHECGLLDAEEPLERFAAEVAGLGASLGVLLVQLPPSLAFDAECAASFFAELRTRFGGRVGVACEPRHRSWFTPEAETVLLMHEVARVAADPPRCAADGEPGGWRALRYFRLHGSPQIYYSSYDEHRLALTRRALAASGAGVAASWCIFDNTAAHAALGNALALRAMMFAD
jgi:uncharacterized protein YecE (DUF72 family)